MNTKHMMIWMANTANNICDYYSSKREQALIIWKNHRKIIISCSVLSVFLALTFAIIQLAFDYVHYAAVVDARLKDNSLRYPAGIYAAPRRVSVGELITKEQLVESLVRANYLEGTQGNDFSAGNYTATDNELEIRTNTFGDADPPIKLLVRFNQNRISAIKNSETGESISSILLQAELLTADFETKKQARQALSYDELPEVLINALCAIEDRRFFSHHGIDTAAIIRAALKNFRSNQIREGGSTITQQLIKNQFLTSERTWKRKFAEMMMSIAIERRLSKQQILTIYCDRVYLGQSGLTAIYGFKQGARVFFGKQPSELSLSEAAFLVGLVKSPNRYTPYSHTERATLRRNLVLDAMVNAGYISQAEATTSKNEQLACLPPQQYDYASAPHFVDYVRRGLDKYEPPEFDWRHARVQTSLDLDLQQAANQAVAANLERVSKLVKNKNGSQPDAALVALNPQTGEILAMVGGRDYGASQFNRATDAGRQPGSVFKPIIYATALTRGLSPATTFINAPHEIEFGYKAIYRPNNFGRSYTNAPVTLRDALVRSLNVVAVDAAMQIGLGNIAAMAERMGMPRPEAYPSMALGAMEVTPMDVARAYTTFANNGVRVDPLAVTSIKLNNETLISNDSAKTTILSPTINYLITDVLSDVVNRGTASSIRRLGYRGPAAGKTGTSRDAWFVGYTPKLLVVVWVGYDDNTDLGMTGGQAAVPIWTDFIKRAIELRPDLAANKFAQAAGLETVEVCAETGALANSYCPHHQRMLLANYLVPNECFQHQAPISTLTELLPSLEVDNQTSEEVERSALLEETPAEATVYKPVSAKSDNAPGSKQERFP